MGIYRIPEIPGIPYTATTPYCFSKFWIWLNNFITIGCFGRKLIISLITSFSNSNSDSQLKFSVAQSKYISQFFTIHNGRHISMNFNFTSECISVPHKRLHTCQTIFSVYVHKSFKLFYIYVYFVIIINTSHLHILKKYIIFQPFSENDHIGGTSQTQIRNNTTP